MVQPLTAVESFLLTDPCQEKYLITIHKYTHNTTHTCEVYGLREREREREKAGEKRGVDEYITGGRITDCING